MVYAERVALIAEIVNLRMIYCTYKVMHGTVVDIYNISVQ